MNYYKRFKEAYGVEIETSEGYWGDQWHYEYAFRIKIAEPIGSARVAFVIVPSRYATMETEKAREIIRVRMIRMMNNLRFSKLMIEWMLKHGWKLDLYNQKFVRSLKRQGGVK